MKKIIFLLVVFAFAGSVLAANNYFEPSGTPGGQGNCNDSANW